MWKGWISLVCVLTIALPNARPCFGAVKDRKAVLEQLLSELGQGKEHAISLVQEVIASQPNDEDRKSLKDMYDLAQYSYWLWAKEAAVAVEQGEDIKLDSQIAQDAKKKVNALGQFAKAYAERREKAERSDHITTQFSHNDWERLKRIAKWIYDNWPRIEKVAKEYKQWRKKHQKEERAAIARKIKDAADWPNFNDIPSKPKPSGQAA